MKIFSPSRLLSRKLVLEVVLTCLALAAAIPSGKYIARLVAQSKNHVVRGDYSQYMRGKPKSITLYGTKSCPACIATRQYFAERSIEFNDLDIDVDAVARQEYERLGTGGVPVIIAKHGYVPGFLPQEIASLINTSHSLRKN